jgi:hypothetical protein
VTCTSFEALSSPAGRGDGGSRGGALGRLSFFLLVVVMMDGERCGTLLLCFLVVPFCCSSPCRPTVVVRCLGRAAEVPPDLQSGGGRQRLGCFSVAPTAPSSLASTFLPRWKCSQVLLRRSPLYPLFKCSSFELIHADGCSAVAIFCRHGGMISTSSGA